MESPGWQSNSVAEWMLLEGWKIQSPVESLAAMSNKFRAAGVPIDRMRLTVRLLHPQVNGVSFTWSSDNGEVVVNDLTHEMVGSNDMYKRSPFYPLFEQNAGAIRCRITHEEAPVDYPVLLELKDQGYTDYVALPLDFSDGRRSVITLSTKVEGGFTAQALEVVSNTLPVLARLVENVAMRRTASILLETYLGKRTGDEVLSGKVRRGDGHAIRAVLWFCDLRNSTPLAESMERDAYLELLNDYFDCMAKAILDHDGEVLSYIGDAILAIFPLRQFDHTCPVCKASTRNAVGAAREALSQLSDLNMRRESSGKQTIGTGIGLHAGEVMYGNIGVPSRLDFTVIGPAANEAARIEGLTKELKVPLVVSGDFTNLFPQEWSSLGTHSLRGVSQDHALFTLPEFG